MFILLIYFRIQKYSKKEKIELLSHPELKLKLK